MKKVGLILGTRPEAIKLIPLYKELKKSSDLSTFLISTGQHKEMLNQIFEFFNIQPDINLKIMTKSQGLSTLSAKILTKLDAVFENHSFDLIIVQGDTTSSMIGALAGFYHHIKIAHIEAGLRSNNFYSPFPEEINRKLTSHITSIHFTPTQRATQNLLKEGISNNVYQVGNTIVDSLLLTRKIISKNLGKYQILFKDIIDKDNKNILITIHRRENYLNNIPDIFPAIRDIAINYPSLNFVYPVHKNPVIISQASKYFKKIKNIKLISPLRYDEFVYLLMESYLIISDSGGIQEEAPSLNKPVVVIRNETERPELIESGGGIQCGTQYQSIFNAVCNILNSEEVYNSMIIKKNPFGDGKSVERILNHLKEILN